MSYRQIQDISQELNFISDETKVLNRLKYYQNFQFHFMEEHVRVRKVVN